jgi:hypothetical protein
MQVSSATSDAPSGGSRSLHTLSSGGEPSKVTFVSSSGSREDRCEQLTAESARRPIDLLLITGQNREGAAESCPTYVNELGAGQPEQGLWSSFRYYAYGELGSVLVNEARKAELHIRKIS